MKGFLKFLLILIIVLAIGAAGAYYMISAPTKEIDVTWTEADFQSYMAKLGKSNVSLDGNQASMEDLFADNLTCSGTTAVDEVITSSELTAIANRSPNMNSVLSDVKIKTYDGGLEISATVGSVGPLLEQFPELKEYESLIRQGENKQIYLNATLFYDESSGQFGGSTKEFRVGKVKLPLEQVRKGMTEAGTAGNRIVDRLPGFSVNQFRVTEEGFDFDGTIPKTMTTNGPF